MATTASAFHVTRDQFHLAWDPAIPPIASGPRRAASSTFDCLDASGGQLTATSTRRRPRGARLRSRSTRSTARSRSRAPSPATRSRSTSSTSEPADWGWTASIPGFGLLADDFPEPLLRITPLAGGRVARAEFLPGIRVPVVPFCGEVGVAPIDGPTLDDPARPPRRQHGHAPPDGRRDAVPAGLPRRRPAEHRRRPRRAGRRRGVRDRDRDADARRRSG